MVDFIVIIIIVSIVIVAIRYIYKSRKKGIRCIGCPASGTCNKNNCDLGKKV